MLQVVLHAVELQQFVIHVRKDIINPQLQHVQHVPRKQIVPHVPRQQINVQNVIQVIIQVEPVVMLAQKLQDVNHVLKQQQLVQDVIQDIICLEENVIPVLVKWLNVPLVPVMELLVQNVKRDISWHQLHHVLHAQIKRIVPPVHKLQMLAQNVIQVIIQVELDANYAIQFIQNVHHVLKQRKHVPLVLVDIMLKVEPVLPVLVK